jgi:hypothetical protein
MDYANSRLTASYDSLNSAMVYECFYVDLAGAAPKTILDMGCGTGRLASELGAQAPGDPGPIPLANARRRPPAPKGAMSSTGSGPVPDGFRSPPASTSSS